MTVISLQSEADDTRPPGNGHSQTDGTEASLPAVAPERYLSRAALTFRAETPVPSTRSMGTQASSRSPPS